MNITPEIKKTIRKHALEENPKECCGILFQQKENLEVFKCANYSENPSKHFYITAKDYLNASFCGPFRAIYHSHTSENETFSENDKINSHNHQITFVLYNTVKDSFFSGASFCARIRERSSVNALFRSASDCCGMTLSRRS